MARDLQLKISGINIVTHPHSSHGYVQLLRQAFASRISLSMGVQRLMIGELYPLDREQPDLGLTGRFYRFLNIDSDAEWFNVITNEAATDEELSMLSIPDNLRPNLVKFDFVFYAAPHALYFQAKNKSGLSALAVQKLLNHLFDRAEVIAEFGMVEVHVLPDHTQVQRILNLPILTELHIDLVRPNPDTPGNEADVESRLLRQGARRYQQTYTAERNQSLSPDEETTQAARVAANNGYVRGKGFDANGQRVDESTKDRPWLATVTYNPDVQTAADALLSNTANYPGRRD